MNGARRASLIVMAFMAVAALAGCSSLDGTENSRPRSEEMSFDQMAQTDFNRTVTIAMRDNLESLDRLLEKLYRRNPAEWRKTGAVDLNAAIEQCRQAIRNGQAPAQLGSLRDVEVLSVALDPAYQGDRVGAFIFGLADMIIRAHDGKTRYYVSDVLDA